MPIFFKQQGALNVRMILDDEKILASIDKVRKLINPKSKKQIIKLEEDAYFKDLVETITQYLVNYPKKSQFPSNVYKAVYELIEFATQQFETNNGKISEIISKREKNIKTSAILKEALDTVSKKEEGWIEKVSRYDGQFTEDITEALTIIANEKLNDNSDVEVSKKMIQTKIGNLESNLFLEIDMERIEDSSKALSYIGIELAEALKTIPSPIETLADMNTKQVENTQVSEIEEVEKETEKEVEKEVEKEAENLEIKANINVISTDVENINQEEINSNLAETLETEKIVEEKVEVLEKPELTETLPLDIQLEEIDDIAEIQQEQQEKQVNKIDNIAKIDNIEKIDLKKEISDFKNVTLEVEKQDILDGIEKNKTQEIAEKKGFFFKLKNTKLVKALRYIFGVKLVLDIPVLPEGSDNK